jgi:uncharacterized protein (TIGR03435 family)
MDLFLEDSVYFGMSMSITRCTILATAALAASAWAQPAPPPPAPPSAPVEFEVASIKPSQDSGGPQVHVGIQVDGAQVHLKVVSIRDCIRTAYRLKDYQISGPDWMGASRFDIDAKLPANAPRDQVPEMLQALLSTSFQLKSHRESKEFPVYALVKIGESKLKESPVDPADAGADPAKDAVQVSASGSRAGVNISLGRGSYFNFANNKLEARKITLQLFSDMLARFSDRPVVDMTGLMGRYDLDLDVTPEDYRSMLIRSAINAGVNLPPEALRLLEGSNGESLHAALRMVGLKLEARKAPLDVLVVDHLAKAPIDN